ncbi:MAG TPA: exosortase H [candidate division Zixibacteria bacterium]|nr:exosortase H [candidate division Zixibacteria bacterium]MDD4918686.1 exosortase H [candidate division Zixibacteria bacterium]MDM7973087.1 exosortase H [candidate division Zixibacteria bacterium]HOD66983.1 exosortase H [candidate division Zixibacteria bacterium]HOZ08558.1 exosortase H [candidate division Zixibacteria bacterium]
MPERPPASLSDSRPGRSPALRFVLKFVLLLAVLGGAYAWLTARYAESLGWLMDTTAAVTGSVVSLFFGEVHWSGRFVSYRGFPVEVIDECTGLLEMVIFTAAVLAFSTTPGKKLLGLALGLPAIYLFNILRIVVLVIAGASSKPLFDFLHLYFWQATLILMIASVWIAWIYLVVFRDPKRAVAVPG